MARANAAPLPAPLVAGKRPRDENFPVASLLLARDRRAPVLAFYRFARAADDVADASGLDDADKLARLDQFERGLGGLGGAPQALALHAALAGNARLLEHAATLLQAFRRDVMVDSCTSWGDLMAYCHCSAAPVGRFLLDLHGQPSHLQPAADALCAALQVLNHLQDCGADYVRLGRVYLPADWMRSSGLPPSRLGTTEGGPALRHVLDLMLDRVDMLIDQAEALPTAMDSRPLATQTAVTVEVARRLASLLRRRDPLSAPVRLSALGYGGALARGLAKGLRRQA